MSIILKQSTASQEIPLGPFLDTTDGDTEETGLTIANTDIKLWKAGATTLANKNSGGATHISNGIYYAVLDATDTNTLGSMKIFVHVAGALFCTLTCLVLPAASYDSLIAGTSNLSVNLVADQSAATIGTVTTVTNAVDISATGADTVLDEVVEGTTTLRHSIKLLNSITAGKVTGGGTTSIVYRDIGDTKNRITMAVDTNGNRSSVSTVVT
jgi:hypothetical protein